MNRSRQVVFGIWLLCAIGGISFYLANRAQYTPEVIAGFFEEHESWFLLVYFCLLIARALVLLPATPLIVAGSLLLPDHPWILLLVTLVGLLISSALIYFFSDWLGFRAHFERAAPKQIARVERWMKHPMGVFLVAGSAVAMVVPTDLVCYVAGTVRMPFPRFMGALIVGEIILCSMYIFGGGWFIKTVL